MAKSMRIIVVFLVAGLSLGLAGWVYYTKHHNTKPVIVTPPPPPTTSSIEPPQNPNPLSSTLSYKVYFSRRPDSDEDPARIVGYARTSQKVEAQTGSVAFLITGPTEAEAADGAFTKVILSGESNCIADFRLTIKDQIATLQFCRTFVVADTIGLTQAAAQINTTLEQFSNIDKVMVLNKTGGCLFGGTAPANCKRQP